MATEIEYALIAGYAYHTTRDEINWFPAPPKPKGVSITIFSGLGGIGRHRGEVLT